MFSELTKQPPSSTSTDKLSRFIFHKGYEIFIHSLDYDIKNAWTCDKCPKSLNVGEREEDFDDVEVHISDGIDMGTIQNTLKGIVEKKIFMESKVEKTIVSGVEAFERTFISKQSERKCIKQLLENELSKQKSLKSIRKKKIFES